MTARPLRKIYQRLSEPVFYEKRWRQVCRQLEKLLPGTREPEPAFRLDDLPPAPRVTVLIAHPDDELFCAGTICELASRGAAVEVLCLTRGEGGPTGGMSREALGKVREEELRRSCTALGVGAVRFLDYVDPMSWEFRVFAPQVTVPELARRVEEQVGSHQSDLLLTHGSNGEYWHPAHLLAHRAALHVARRRTGLWLATFHAWLENHPVPRMLNVDDRPNLLVDVTPWSRQRLEAWQSHASQARWFERETGKTGGELVALTPREACRVRCFS